MLFLRIINEPLEILIEVFIRNKQCHLNRQKHSKKNLFFKPID
jgi:hypothetical protein